MSKRRSRRRSIPGRKIPFAGRVNVRTPAEKQPKRKRIWLVLCLVLITESALFAALNLTEIHGRVEFDIPPSSFRYFGWPAVYWTERDNRGPNLSVNANDWRRGKVTVFRFAAVALNIGIWLCTAALSAIFVVIAYRRRFSLRTLFALTFLVAVLMSLLIRSTAPDMGANY